MRSVSALVLAALLGLAVPAAAAERPVDQPLAGPTMLGEGPTVVPIRVERLQAPAAGLRPELVIEGLAFDTPPGVLYDVSLQRADGRRAPLGVIGFFNLTAPPRGGAPADDGRRSFDAADALHALGGEASALVFEPSAGVTGPGISAKPRAGARVRFGSAVLRWE